MPLWCSWQLHFALRAMGDSSQTAPCHGAAGGGSCFAPLQLYLPPWGQFLDGARHQLSWGNVKGPQELGLALVTLKGGG